MRIKWSLMAMMVFAIVFFLMLPPMGQAATSNPSPGSPGYQVMAIPITGNYTSSVTGIVKFKMPWPAKVVYVGSVVQATSAGTATVDVKVGGTSILSSPITTTTSIADGTLIASPLIADEATVSIDLTLATSPNFTNFTVFIAIKRL